MAVISVKTQIIPSALTVTIGATAFWLVATFVFGRLYCSSVCPVGTLQDMAIWLRRFVRTRAGKPRTIFGFKVSPFRYRHGSKRRWTILILYVASLIVGILRLEWLLQPWTLLQSAAGLVRPGAVADTWGAQTAWGLLGHGVMTGCVVSAIFLAVLLFMALLDGRWFCNEICPIGTGLGFVGEYSLYHIEIDPDKCINCMKCEEVCPSHCVKVVSRYVDDARCVRCFNCLKVCPNDAVRYQINRNRRQTPLMQRRKQLQ